MSGKREMVGRGRLDCRGLGGRECVGYGIMNRDVWIIFVEFVLPQRYVRYSHTSESFFFYSFFFGADDMI